MGPPRASTASKRKPGKGENKKDKKSTSGSSSALSSTASAQQPPPRRRPQGQLQQQTQPDSENEKLIDLSSTIPLTLQQLVLNVFKFALLQSQNNTRTATVPSSPRDEQDPNPETLAEEPELDIKSLIQTIKSHLYNRDFDSAFTEANGDLLRAYALRWSAARALGYAGVFKSLLKDLIKGDEGILSGGSGLSPYSLPRKNHIVCIGGGAGAEIVALAAAWRDLMDELDQTGQPCPTNNSLSDSLEAVSLESEERGPSPATTTIDTSSTNEVPLRSTHPPSLSITAVDIADWSSVVDRLSSAIRSPIVPGSKSHPAPLCQGSTTRDGLEDTADFVVDFKHLDVLSMSDGSLCDLYLSRTTGASTVMVTLMFTLNELFSTSMAKTTAFLLRTTDILDPGTVLLVVDSPGSYSTLKLGKQVKLQGTSDPSTAQERQYPMKFLLDHTLLSVAKGKWERIFSQDSRWWRRDATRLRYDVGEGAGLEDMRFQVHVYRRL